MKEAFDLFDMNGDKRICSKELGSVLRAIGLNPTEKSLKEMLVKFDKNNSGFIDYDEYLECLDNFTCSSQEIEVQLRQAFLFFDKDKNGQLSIKELQNVLVSMGEPLSYKETADILKLADTNHDGKLDADEFTKFLCEKV
ncbi:hypothetical protein SNE40_016848 [Patella caerulea]